MNDLISRKAAIDALDGSLIVDGKENAERVMEYLKGINARIKALPSARPEIIRCEDCRWWERESICEGHCLEIDLHHVDEDHYCSFAERRTDE